MSDRFWAKVDKSGDCWMWTGTRTKDGYGMFKHGGRSQLANRVSMEISGSPSPFLKAVVRHRCDTPSCVNPDHLEWGTQKQNMQDAISRGRFPMAQLEMRHEQLRSQRVSLTCSHCGCVFTRAQSGVGDHNTFCSRACTSSSAASITHCRHGHEFTPENTYLAPRTGFRNCRACNRHRAVSARAKKSNNEHGHLTAEEAEVWIVLQGLEAA